MDIILFSYIKFGSYKFIRMPRSLIILFYSDKKNIVYWKWHISNKISQIRSFFVNPVYISQPSLMLGYMQWEDCQEPKFLRGLCVLSIKLINYFHFLFGMTAKCPAGLHLLCGTILFAFNETYNYRRTFVGLETKGSRFCRCSSLASRWRICFI